jgi:hypothetical protein
MEQMLYLTIAWCLGVIVCAYLGYRIVARYQLPWKSTLMYFGVLPYPDEVARRLREVRSVPTRERVASRNIPAGRGSPA